MRQISIVWMAALVFALAGAVTACGGGDTGPSTTAAAASVTSLAPGTTTSPETPAEQVFSLEQLAGFDGKEGRPAYIAVDGVVYDVSGSSQWPEGRHSSCNLGAMAGQDLSEEITKAPSSMRALVERLPVVGRLD